MLFFPGRVGTGCTLRLGALCHDHRLVCCMLRMAKPGTGTWAAEEIAGSDPDRFVLLQQFKNPANPNIHFETTGPEIWQDTEGNIDVLVCGIGTGGTLTGVSRFLKNVKKKAVLSVGVEPAASPEPTNAVEEYA